MIPVTSFAGKEVALFGLGGSGLASAQALVAGGADVIAFDDSAASLAKARAAGIATATCARSTGRRSPRCCSRPACRSPIRAALVGGSRASRRRGDRRHRAVLPRAAQLAPDSPFVAITGTNGKSTTTALIAHLLRAPAARPSSAATSAPRS
jgi:UDP-N-acetylmuramoylalanine--D-glutamate ligase